MSSSLVEGNIEQNITIRAKEGQGRNIGGILS